MKEIKDMTDREIQEAILGNTRTTNSLLKSINGWVTFLGIVTLVSVLLAALVIWGGMPI